MGKELPRLHGHDGGDVRFSQAVTAHPSDELARERLAALASQAELDVMGGCVLRTSSRFCLGVEHGDYNGTDLFGVGTDRFIWVAYKPNGCGRVRLLSWNFPDDGVIEYVPGEVPAPGSDGLEHSWGRFPMGVDWTMRRAGFPISVGMDAVVFGNIPGGGMSRSAALSLSLILAALDVNRVREEDGLRIVELSQQVENDYVGSPCGVLDPTMIYFARAGMGTHYRPAERSIEYVPLGAAAPDFRLVSLDTGTTRPGLEKSTYTVRRAECDQALTWLRQHEPLESLASVRDAAHYAELDAVLRARSPRLADRLAYIHQANTRFPLILQAWRAGDLARVGELFRQDGYGLRDLYQISGPELEAMCDIARTVPGVLGERMLGGGDKGASGAVVLAPAVEALKAAVAQQYPQRHPAWAQRYEVHACSLVDGITRLPGLAS